MAYMTLQCPHAAFPVLWFQVCARLCQCASHLWQLAAQLQGCRLGAEHCLAFDNSTCAGHLSVLCMRSVERVGEFFARQDLPGDCQCITARVVSGAARPGQSQRVSTNSSLLVIAFRVLRYRWQAFRSAAKCRSKKLCSCCQRKPVAAQGAAMCAIPAVHLC